MFICLDIELLEWGEKIVLDLFRGLSDYKVKVLRCFEGIQTSSEYIVKKNNTPHVRWFLCFEIRNHVSSLSGLQHVFVWS